MYLVFILYKNGNVCEFLTKDNDYITLACESMYSDDDVIEVNIKFIKEIK